MLRSLYLRAKRPLQQQLRKMNETALERTEQSLKHQEDGRKLLQQDFLSNIYGPGFHRRREQIHSSLQVEKSLERRKDSLQTALLVSSSFPTQETPDELNPLTTENFQTGGNFPATCSFSAEGQIGDYGCSLEVDTNGNASFEMSETGAAKQFAETQTSEKLQSADHHITLTKDEITGVERAADGTVTEYQATEYNMKIGGIVNPDGGLSFFTDPVSEALVEGSLRVKDGQIVEGSCAFDLQQLCEHAAELLDAEGLKQLSTLLENNNIEGLQVFWGENVIGGQITIDGVDLSLKQKTFEVEGSQHSSTFEYDDAGNVTHYYGTTEVTSGTVDAIYTGIGVHVPENGVVDAGAHVDFKIGAQNDFVQDRSEHTFNRDGNMIVESHSEFHIVDKSTELFGLKVGGSTETERHTFTKVESKDEGLFVHKKTTQTTDETIHVKENHGIIRDEIEISKDITITSNDIEYQLSACGLGFLTPFAKLAVEFYKSGGDLDVSKAGWILATAASASLFIMAFTRLLGPQAAMVLVIIAGMVPQMAQGEHEAAQQQVYRLMTSLLVSTCVGWSVKTLLWCTPLAPCAGIIGQLAGMSTSMLLSEPLVRKILEEIERAKQHGVKCIGE